jgi:YNFM family putative membrane transporter
MYVNPKQAAWTVRGSSAYRRVSLALFLAGFATFSLLYCVQPLLPAFARDFAISPAVSSLALSLTLGFLAFAVLCASVGSEVLGRRGLMLVSMSSASILNIAAAAAPSRHALLIARALEGFLLGGVPAVAMTYLAEEIHPESLGSSMGLYVGGTALGGMLGRVGVGVITEFISWRAALAILGAFDLLAAAGFFALLPPSRNFVRRTRLDAAYHIAAWRGHARHEGLPYLLAIGFLVMGAFVTVYNYASFRLSAPPYNLTPSEISFIFVVYLFGAIASTAAGNLADAIGRGPVLIGGVLIALAGVGLTLSQNLVGIISGIAFVTIGFFISHAVASGWVGRMAVSAKGHATSLYLLTYYIGASVMGSVGGWFWAAGHWTAIATFTGVQFMLALGAAFRLQRLEVRMADR